MAEDLKANGTLETAPERKGVIFPTCPKCGADPLELKRLRYDFPDGVLVETLFCANLACRAVVAAQVVYIPAPKR